MRRPARRRGVRLTLHDNLDGTVTGHFTVPTLAGAILRKAIQQMVSPRRRREVGRRTHPRASRRRRARASTRSATGPAEQGGWAFVELLEHLPTDRLHGKVAATVVVTVEHEHLREPLGAAHLDTGHDLSAAEARRLACSAGILPAVLDGTSLPLDLGRTKRFFTEAQRVALATTYDECAAHGCDRPYAWCDLHHEDPWSRGGATDLGLAVPVCGFHHRLAHDPRHEHQVHTAADGRKSVSFRAAVATRCARREGWSGDEAGGLRGIAALRRRRIAAGRWPTGAGRLTRGVASGARMAPLSQARRDRGRSGRCGVAGAQASALPRRTRRWPRRTSPGTTAGLESTGSAAGVRGRPASRTASARASRSSVLGCGSG